MIFKKEKFFNENINILVTGGAGFIGGCLISRLLQETNAKIFNLDKLSYASNLSWLKNNPNSQNHKLINLDLIDNNNTIVKKIHQSIKDVTEGIENFR